MTATTHTPSRVERPNPNTSDTPIAAGPSGARRCRIRNGANMTIKRIYRGLPTIVLLVVAALIQWLAISVFI